MLKSFDNADQRVDERRLETMLDQVRHSSDPQCALLIEHLSTARDYIRGQMPEEFALNLRLAQEVLPMMEDSTLRKELSEGIAALVDGLRLE